ncbi:uncharacterized protein NDAI_0G00450 [Naumovozyma dairenensis CBS 421]|uniref:T6SS Phospholipase effector Tle1-like catalytic domain-containing protein n=1 Tax=Naumovozyma dairenensis (strain ATCC 10597 / BCRC 20456 / CBS 421 / NBRC 0211 / NRRL Y-12639) TaxID=1071378 RepID=G0WDG0_NAUDC|nr:hypothetical protein NDAI_0G00450 [Naumovozyma dairenensis CBS 421]CCD25821.2 hypothetical protein NDAI_0G00450 [Naumovozyma dairenensis CBS 421]
MPLSTGTTASETQIFTTSKEETNSATLKTSKNIILCFDGTRENFGPQPFTNILKIFGLLENDKDQICYYQPGVGINGDLDRIDENLNLRRFTWSKFYNILDSMFAFSLDSHIVSAYIFLMQNYEIGDKIYMFGFSRGAFIARVLAGMIGKVGLLHPGLEELVTLAWKIYQSWEYSEQPNQSTYTTTLASEFKNIFCRDYEVRICFQGLFDSVNSVGILRDRLFPFTQRSNIVDHVRHCVSIDERRGKFKQQGFSSNSYSTRLFSLQFRTYILEEFSNNLTPVESNASENISTKEIRNPLIDFTIGKTKSTDTDCENPCQRFINRKCLPIETSRKSVEGIFQICEKLDNDRCCFNSDGRDIQGDKNILTPDLIEKWFIGDHSDIGGGWEMDRNTENFVSLIPLRWIIMESMKFGVRFKNEPLKNFLKENLTVGSILSLTHDFLDLCQLKENNHKKTFQLEKESNIPLIRSYLDQQAQKPEFQQDTDEFRERMNRKIKYTRGGYFTTRMSLGWWILEFLPIGLKLQNRRGKWRKVYIPNLGQTRSIPENADLHWSVYWKIKFDPNYRPTNLPKYARDIIEEFLQIKLDNGRERKTKTIMSHMKSYPNRIENEGEWVLEGSSTVTTTTATLSFSSLSDQLDNTNKGINATRYYELRSNFLKWQETDWKKIPDDMVLESFLDSSCI